MSNEFYSVFMWLYFTGCMLVVNYWVWSSTPYDLFGRQWKKSWKNMLVSALASWPMFFILMRNMLRKRWKK